MARPRKPLNKWPTIEVGARVDGQVVKTLEMLGFDIPELIRNYLTKVSDEAKCPCCLRKVAPVIVGRKV